MRDFSFPSEEFDKYMTTLPEDIELMCICGHGEFAHSRYYLDLGTDCHNFDACTNCDCNIFNEKPKKMSRDEFVSKKLDDFLENNYAKRI